MLVDPMGGPAYLWPFVLAFILGYLAGSIPFGVLLTRMAGAGDLTKLGSGNIGATNVLRTGRKGLALATLLADVIKGGLPVWLGHFWLGPDIAVLVGLGAVLGHCFPVWLKFKGGKGVATAAGVILALTPLALLIGLLVFIAVVWVWRYVSLGSISAAIAMPVIAWILDAVQPAELYIILGLIIVLKHYDNIRRLIRGEENRLSFSTKK